MKSILAAAITAFTIHAQADIIVCHFTEPFFSLRYSTTTGELLRSMFDGNAEVISVTKNVSFQITGPNRFELLSEDKKVLLKLDLNFKGSDGMSDTEYPYDAQYPYDETSSHWGGCESNFLKAKRQ